MPTKIHKCARCGKLKILYPENADDVKISHDCRRHKTKGYQARMASLLNSGAAKFWVFDFEKETFVISKDSDNERRTD